MVCGQTAGLCLEEQIYVQRGEVAARADQPVPKITSRLRVSLFWLGKKPLQMDKEYVLKLGTARVKVQVEKIHQIIDAGQMDLSSGDNRPGETRQIERHQVAECTLKLQRAIAFDLANEQRDTGRFVIIDDYEICGGGIILEDLPDSEKWARDITLVRDFKWIKSLITPEERAEHYNQRASLILITGEKGAGRKRIANQLETSLFNSGKMVYYLGIGSLIYGVDADIHESDHEQHQQEHIRRLAEVAHILLDAGLILIVTAIELTQSDIDLIKTIINGSTPIETVWVGNTVTTDVVYDLKVQSEDVQDTVIRIKRLLQDRNVTFTL